MEEAPVCKKARLMMLTPVPVLSNDPSIPLSDGLSPFSTLPENEMNHIFLRYTGDVKSKMKLQLVCQKFGTQIKKRVCWSHDNKLDLRGFEDEGWINEISFTPEQTPNALSILLELITVRTIVIGNVSFIRSDMLSICAVINEHRAKFALLDCIDIETELYEIDCLQFLITSLMICGLSRVKSLSVVFHSDLDNRCFDYFLPFIMYCHQNLVFLKIVASEFDISYSELCQCLTKCSKLVTLHLDIRQPDAGDLPTIVTLLNSLKYLKNLNLEVILPNPSAFTNLSGDCRSRMERISGFYIALIELAAWNSFMEQAINFFPNLLELRCPSSQTWEAQTIVSTVSSIFNNLRNRGGRRSIFKLRMMPTNVNECFTRLTKEDGLNAKIMIENGLYKCFKGDVEILLEIDN